MYDSNQKMYDVIKIQKAEKITVIRDVDLLSGLKWES